ncbi:MAG TPA: hypothetical protein VMW69_00760, partial [Spirochaetia bacterium]|nr:hypothetical protein [Spirochaetia bacterium]
GWPLYTFAGDTKPGQTNGQGFKGVWFVASVPFYTVMDASSSSLGGNYLVNGDGKTLYYFTKDSAGKSVCNGGCAQLWPPYDPSRITLPSDLKASSFSMVTRSDGSQQLAYKGYPLYTFVKDSSRGQATGEGFRKVWYVIDPAKFHPGASASSGYGGSTAVAYGRSR